MAYLPIEDHGVIGNMHTTALVGRDGAIDWFCYPRFDSPSVFAALLDDERGGAFRIAPVKDDVVHKQFYWPDTNVLVTRFLSERGVGQVTDFMPLAGADERTHCWIIRRVAVVRGSMPFRLECRPAFDYARARHELSVRGSAAVFRTDAVSLGLAGEVPLRAEGPAATAEFELTEGQTVAFVLRPLGASQDGG